ncbi:phosphoesterase RecJ-like protein [Fusobacterium sp. PH5-44]
MDSASLMRTGSIGELAKNTFIINIDHHISNPGYGNINYINPISSTSEIIYNFMCYNKIPLDHDIGECLYTGLVNDTGNFKHSNCTKETFLMAGDLIECGVNNSKVVREFMENKSYAAIKLIGASLYRMEFFEKEKLAYFYLSHEEMEKYGGKKEDTESIVERLIDYNMAEVSFFLREEENGLKKGSLRSKKVIDVNEIAMTFGGGGHKMAAGFTSGLTEKEILDKILKFLKK